MKDEKLEYKTKKKEGLTKLFSYQEVQMIVKKTGDKGPKITGSNTAAKFLRESWSECLNFRESFYALYLNQANEIIGKYLISQGGVSGTVVDCKLIFIGALQLGASAVIVAHNHPSGNLMPSGADITVTKKIKQGGKFLDIPLLDHIILTEESYTSFADDDLI
jgi:DNA repair protein RadC